jgi:hypothetical protein
MRLDQDDRFVANSIAGRDAAGRQKTSCVKPLSVFAVL